MTRFASQWRKAALAAALAGAAAVAGACGGAGSPTSRSSASPGLVQTLAVFGRCMRSHGEPNFYYAKPQSSPSPSASQPPLGFAGYVIPGVNPFESPFPAAMHACQHLLPGGGPPPVSQQQLKSELKFAACMRTHGFPDYPDPQVRDGVLVNAQMPRAINTSSPKFRSAAKACGLDR